MGEPLTSQQLLHNSYHLSIRSSLLAIQSTLSLQQTMLRSDDSTFVDIKSVIASQNANLQRFTKTIVETFSKIFSYKPPLPQPRSTPSAMAPARSPPKMAPTTTTAAGTISAAATITLQTLLPLTTASFMIAALSSTPTATTKTLTSLSPSTPTPIQAVPQQTSQPSLSKLPLTSSTSKPTPPTAPPTTTKSAPLFSPSVCTKTGTIIDVKQLSICYGQKHVILVGFKTPQSPLEISINQLGKISSDSLHGSNLYGGIKVQFDWQTSFASIEQYGHILFDVMLDRDAKRIFERTMFIFDPGGDILDAKDFLSIWSNHVE